MKLIKFIENTILEYLNESYRLTFDDKQGIEKNIRTKYKKYIEDIKSHNDDIKLYKNALKSAKAVWSDEDYENLLKNFGYYLNAEVSNSIRFNKFYLENIEQVKNDYIKYKEKNATTNFSYKSKQEKNLKNNEYENFYNSLVIIEKKSIINFLKIVAERVNSDQGESIDRREVRNAFFKTPVKFQKMFSETPSPYLWRGDYEHPCNDDYDHNDSNYLVMQSFSTSKYIAKKFGFNFNAKNIKTYSGSFSLPLFVEYGDETYGFGDDEGEVMFFDVVYKCENKTKIL